MSNPRKRQPLLPYVIAALAITAVILVVTGRFLDHRQFDGWQDPIYSVLLAFTLDGSFLGEQNIVTVFGSFAAALALYLTLFGGLWLLFRRGVVAWRASHRRGQIIIVGDDEDAYALAADLGKSAKVVLATDDKAPSGRFLTIERPKSSERLAAVTNLAKARAVVLMLADEQLNAAIATSLAGGRENAAQPAIWARIANEILADRVTGVVSGAARILVFDEAQMIARNLFAQHPAHAVAERMAAPRVHFVVAGFGRLGQALAEEAVFSGIADGLDGPMITVLDPAAAHAERIYRELRPALGSAVDIAFIELPVSSETALALPRATLHALAARDTIAPVTGIALCLDRDADNFRLALALPDIRRREGRFFAPAFMPVSDLDGSGNLFATAGRSLDPNSGIVPLARPTSLIASDILDTAHRDDAARRLHAAYLAADGRSADASTDWEHLPETYRRANRRGADHIAAKLFSMGLTGEHDAHAPVAVERAAHALHIAPLVTADAEGLDRLAALEHRRWRTDRVVDGWNEGPRDDDRKLHPLLRPGAFDALPEVERQKDRRQVAAMLSSIVAAGDGARREIRVALAGHRDLDPAEQARGVAAVIAELAPRLGHPHLAVTLVSPLAPGADIALCEAMAATLRGRCGELRLLVPESLPWKLVLDIAANEAGGGEAGRQLVAAMVERRQALIAQFSRTDIVRIGFAGHSDDSYRRDPALLHRALSRANAYMARRTDICALLWDGEAPRGPGGTGELADFWRAPASIPAGIDVQPSPRHGVTRSAGDLVIGRVTRQSLRT